MVQYGVGWLALLTLSLVACGRGSQGSCPHWWQTREAASFKSMERAAHSAAAGIRDHGIPHLGAAQVDTGNVIVTVSTWPRERTAQCELLRQIASVAYGANGSTAVPMEVLVSGQVLRVAVTVHEPRGDYWQLMDR